MDKEYLGSLEEELPKLIRDKIPDIIRKNDKIDPTIGVASTNEEFLEFLLKKVLEEAIELYIHRNIVGDIADIEDLLEEIKKLEAITEEGVADAKLRKNSISGGFKERLLLISKPQRKES